MFIDTHAHLTSEKFDGDRDEVIRKAQDAGVQYIVNPGTDLDDSRRAVELAEKYPGVFACVGFHPHEASKADERSLSEIEALCSHPKVVAIGEIGLDFFYDFSPRGVQTKVFRDQLEIARKRNLPVVIHTRDSLAQAVQIVAGATADHPSWRSHGAAPPGRYPAPRGVFHCYPGDVETGWELIRMGFYLSLPGIITFKKPGNALAVASGISLEHLLLETDSPYLSPAPLRGTRNEPSHIPLIASRLAELQHLSVEDVARSTAFGAYKLFGIGEPGPPQIVYQLRNSLYLNITIRCNADCVFCDRKGEAVIKGHNLKILREPDADEVIRAIGDPRRYDEVVFCGYGEPTIRLEELKQIARSVKEQGGRTRLNTDGHGNIINKRNIVPELVGLIDSVSISLNSTDPRQYGELMRVDGPRYFSAMLEFARECVRLLPKVVMTIVDLPEVDEENVKTFVEKEIGATLQIRPFF